MVADEEKIGVQCWHAERVSKDHDVRVNRHRLVKWRGAVDGEVLAKKARVVWVVELDALQRRKDVRRIRRVQKVDEQKDVCDHRLGHRLVALGAPQ